MIRYQVDYNDYDRSWTVGKMVFDGVGKIYSWQASFRTRQMARNFKRILENNIHVDYYKLPNGKEYYDIND